MVLENSRGKENEMKESSEIIFSVGHRLFPDKVAVRPEHVLPSTLSASHYSWCSRTAYYHEWSWFRIHCLKSY